MRPIPPEILAAYPPRPGTLIPDRPWWRVGMSSGRFAWIRSDDATLPLAAHEHARTREADVARYDAAHPLPHPGFRAGQVWAWVEEVPTFVVRGDELAKRRALGVVLTELRGGECRLPGLAWLLADPACPWLAPWGPA